jgi:hypothetical protein
MIAFHSRENEPPWIILDGIEILKRHRHVAFSAELGGKIVGCGGMVMWRAGLGYPWVMISDELAAYPLWLHRTVKTYYRRTVEIFGIKEMYSEAAIVSQRNQRWIQSFGFKPRAERFEVNGREYQRHECEVGG